MLKNYKVENHPYSTGFFSLDNINSNLPLLQKLFESLPSEEIYTLFENISKKEKELIEYINYDYNHKIYEALMETTFKNQAELLSDKITQEFKSRDMLLTYYSLLFYVHDLDVHINKEILNNSDKGGVINVLHFDLYHLVPFILGKYVNRELIFYADGGALERTLAIAFVFNPNLKKRVTILPMEYKSVIKAMRKVKRGALLFIMPEINTSSTKKRDPLVVDFFENKVIAPIGAQKIAEKCDVPVYVSYFNRESMVLSIQKIKQSKCAEEMTRELWVQIQVIIKKAPHKWSMWEKWNDIKWVC